MGKNAKNILYYYDFWTESVLPVKLLSQRPCLQDDLFPSFAVGCGGCPEMPWGLWFCVLGGDTILPQPPLCLLVSARQVRHREQQAVWLQATCTLFLFLSILLPPWLTRSWLLLSFCLSRQWSHNAARDLGWTPSSAQCFEKRSSRQLIWFGLHSALTTPPARRAGGEAGGWWRRKIHGPQCDAAANLVLSGWKCSLLICSSENRIRFTLFPLPLFFLTGIHRTCKLCWFKNKKKDQNPLMFYDSFFSKIQTQMAVQRLLDANLVL